MAHQPTATAAVFSNIPSSKQTNVLPVYNVVIPDICGTKTILLNSVSLFSKRLIVVTVLARQTVCHFGYKGDKNNPLKTLIKIKTEDSIRTAQKTLGLHYKNKSAISAQ